MLEASPPPDDRLTQRVMHVADTVGEFIAWWGFKGILGRVWTVLALRGEPLSQAEIARLLGVSRALVSASVAELLDFGLVRRSGPHHHAPYEAVLDVWPVIADVLRTREWMMIEQARVALESAIEEAEVSAHHGQPVPWKIDRLRLVLGLTETAQAFLRILVKLRVPRTIDALGGWLTRASGLIQTLRNIR
jgi:DNA-binding transcriptional regulator GbsR (MarR family)